MAQVWKYQIPLRGLYKDEDIVRMMPRNATPVSFHIMNDTGNMWAVVPFPDEEKIERTFCLYGTGVEFDDTDKRFIGTVIQDLQGVEYVWHLFEHFIYSFKVTGQYTDAHERALFDVSFDDPFQYMANVINDAKKKEPTATKPIVDNYPDNPGWRLYMDQYGDDE